MGKTTTITINQTERDADLKSMIHDLQRHGDRGSNPSYFGRSESVIVKMLLEEPLRKEHQRICGDKYLKQGKRSPDGHGVGNPN